MQEPKNSTEQGKKVYAALPAGSSAYEFVAEARVFEESDMRAFADATAALRAQAAPPAPAAVAVPDDFRGDTASLVRNILALLELDAAGALVPHGVGGHARGLLSAAAARLAVAPAQASRGITIDFKQATELLAMFGGEPAEVALITGDGHSGNGLYASYTDMPEEGAEFLGTSDNEAAPAATAQEHATQLAGQGPREGATPAMDKWKLVDGDMREAENGIITYHAAAYAEGLKDAVSTPALEAPAAPTGQLRARIDPATGSIVGYFSDEQPLAAAPQAPAAPAGLPSGWVPCVVTHEGGHPEEVAYGPQIMMDRLEKWLERYFALIVQAAPAAPVEMQSAEAFAFASTNEPTPILRHWFRKGFAAGQAAPAAPADACIDWDEVPEDSRERAMFDRNLDLCDGDPRIAVATSLRIWATTHGNGSFSAQCAVMANEVAKLHLAPSAPAAPAVDAPGLLLTVIQRLNGNPYSLTKSECISEVEAMRDAAIAAQAKGGEQP